MQRVVRVWSVITDQIQYTSALEGRCTPAVLLQCRSTKCIEENLEGSVGTDLVQGLAFVLEDFLAGHVLGLEHATLGWTVHEAGSRARALCFATPREVLRHLRDTGVNGRASRPWTRRDLDAFCRDYDARFGKAGRVPLTYQPVWLIARKT